MSSCHSRSYTLMELNKTLRGFPLCICLATIKIETVPLLLIPSPGIMESIGIVFIRVHPDAPLWRVGIIDNVQIKIGEQDYVRQVSSVTCE